MIKLCKSLVVAVLAAQLAACGGGDDATPTDMPQQRVQAQWAYTDLNETYVIRNETQWQAAWARHQPRSTGDTRPQVDFSRSMVLGVTRGTGSSGCHGLRISKVVETGDDIRVEFVQSRPTANMVCTAALEPLTDFVVVPASPKPVTFTEKNA